MSPLSFYESRRLFLNPGIEGKDWTKEVNSISDEKQPIRSEFYNKRADFKKAVEFSKAWTGGQQEIKSPDWLYGALMRGIGGNPKARNSLEAKQVFWLLNVLSKKEFNVDKFENGGTVQIIEGKCVIQRTGEEPAMYEMYDLATAPAAETPSSETPPATPAAGGDATPQPEAVTTGEEDRAHLDLATPSGDAANVSATPITPTPTAETSNATSGSSESPKKAAQKPAAPGESKLAQAEAVASSKAQDEQKEKTPAETVPERLPWNFISATTIFPPSIEDELTFDIKAQVPSGATLKLAMYNYQNDKWGTFKQVDRSGMSIRQLAERKYISTANGNIMKFRLWAKKGAQDSAPRDLSAELPSPLIAALKKAQETKEGEDRKAEFLSFVGKKLTDLQVSEAKKGFEWEADDLFNIGYESTDPDNPSRPKQIIEVNVNSWPIDQPLLNSQEVAVWQAEGGFKDIQAMLDFLKAHKKDLRAFDRNVKPNAEGENKGAATGSKAEVAGAASGALAAAKEKQAAPEGTEKPGSKAEFLGLIAAKIVKIDKQFEWDEDDIISVTGSGIKINVAGNWLDASVTPPGHTDWREQGPGKDKISVYVDELSDLSRKYGFNSHEAMEKYLKDHLQDLNFLVIKKRLEKMPKIMNDISVNPIFKERKSQTNFSYFLSFFAKRKGYDVSSPQVNEGYSRISVYKNGELILDVENLGASYRLYNAPGKDFVPGRIANGKLVNELAVRKCLDAIDQAFDGISLPPEAAASAGGAALGKKEAKGNAREGSEKPRERGGLLDLVAQEIVKLDKELEWEAPDLFNSSGPSIEVNIKGDITDLPVFAFMGKNNYEIIKEKYGFNDRSEMVSFLMANKEKIKARVAQIKNPEPVRFTREVFNQRQGFLNKMAARIKKLSSEGVKFEWDEEDIFNVSGNTIEMNIDDSFRDKPITAAINPDFLQQLGFKTIDELVGFLKANKDYLGNPEIYTSLQAMPKKIRTDIGKDIKSNFPALAQFFRGRTGYSLGYYDNLKDNTMASISVQKNSKPVFTLELREKGFIAFNEGDSKFITEQDGNNSEFVSAERVNEYFDAVDKAFAPKPKPPTPNPMEK